MKASLQTSWRETMPDNLALFTDLYERPLTWILPTNFVNMLATVLDGCEEDFEVVVISNATLPVTIAGGEEARRTGSPWIG